MSYIHIIKLNLINYNLIYRIVIVCMLKFVLFVIIFYFIFLCILSYNLLLVSEAPRG